MRIQRAIFPLVVFAYWVWVLTAEVYGRYTPSIIPLFLGVLCCIIAALAFAIIWISTRTQNAKAQLYYWSKITIFVICLLYFHQSVVLWGIGARIQTEEKFETCKSTAVDVGGLNFYNVCESSDMTVLAINNVFRDIVYDSSGQIVYAPEKRPKIDGAFLDPTSSSEKIVNITGHYYLVTSSY